MEFYYILLHFKNLIHTRMLCKRVQIEESQNFFNIFFSSNFSFEFLHKLVSSKVPCWSDGSFTNNLAGTTFTLLPLSTPSQSINDFGDVAQHGDLYFVEAHVTSYTSTQGTR